MTEFAVATTATADTVMHLTNINDPGARPLRNSFVAVAVQRELDLQCLNFLK